MSVLVKSLGGVGPTAVSGGGTGSLVRKVSCRWGVVLAK